MLKISVTGPDERVNYRPSVKFEFQSHICSHVNTISFEITALAYLKSRISYFRFLCAMHLFCLSWKAPSKNGEYCLLEYHAV
jgi:hypothetical protein